ncbi:SMI1/KNR4 family protein [Herbaspirillum sp. AP02]|uniref:SMI1/KNR4 family protein n=1 Tax=unclassified Herbaspirillum TaxID=2624150 RepID=UPI0015DB200C|nr:SMI1/KNR4 family protein [Herbaspirillum sp. AP02]NZD69749.1 SMI1/KNR4 family protein [Herbaspirillum sp. AP21]
MTLGEKMDRNLVKAITDLEKVSAGEVIKVPAPDDRLIDEYEKKTGFKFNDDYRYFLKKASIIFYGNIEPLILTKELNVRGELLQEIRAAQRLGVPLDWLPICEDNGDYYCLDQAGRVRFWSGNGVSLEAWETLAEWVNDVWLGAN